MTTTVSAGAARFRLDSSTQRHGRVVIGGSPLKLFRLTARGVDAFDRLARGDEVRSSALVDRLLDAGAVHPRPRRDGALGPGDVTIVVPVYGPAPALPAGAVVVDDGSEPPVHGATVRLPVNRGPAAARNAGLEAVATPLVAFVDADVALPRGWLEPLLAHFDDPRVGLVAPRVRSAPGGGTLADYERQHSPLDMGPEPARVRAGTRVSYVPAAVLVCRVDAIRAIGGFDTGLRFGEDVDLVWRLDEAGWRCRYEPGVEVLHEPRANWATWWSQRVGYGRSAAPLSRRHRGALAPVRMSGWSAGAWALAALGRPFAALAVASGSAAALVPKLPDVPPAVAFGLAWRGNLYAGRTLADAIRRAWVPILLVAALRSRRARRVLLAACLAAGRPTRIVDDVAYGTGMWQGMWRERTIAPIVPRFGAWPGRRRGG